MDLPGEYSVSATFNVSNLSLFFYAGTDSRTNPFEGRGDDMTQDVGVTKASSS